MNDLKHRWGRMQQAMQQMGADGCLLAGGINLYYTTGQMYSGYFYLPAEGSPRFFIKRPNGCEGEGVTYIRKPEQMPELFAAEGLPMPEKTAARGRRTELQRLYAAASHLPTERGRATPPR